MTARPDFISQDVNSDRYKVHSYTVCHCRRSKGQRDVKDIVPLKRKTTGHLWTSTASPAPTRTLPPVTLSYVFRPTTWA